MAKRLYVGNIPWKTTDEDLKQVFSQAGAVDSANIIIDRRSGRSKGFGFVEFENEDDAQKAIEMFNGYEMEGRALVVNEARPMRPRDEAGNMSDSAPADTVSEEPSDFAAPVADDTVADDSAEEDTTDDSII